MDWTVLIQVALSLAKVVLSQATKSSLPAEVIADVQAAVDALQRVHGTSVTKEQVESLRLA